MVINKLYVQKYVKAFIIYEIAHEGVDPRDTLEGTLMRIKKYEGYKYQEYERGRDLLKTCGSYTDAIMKALPGYNLVNRFQKDRLEELLENGNSSNFESALHILFDENQDAQAFHELVDIVGGHFDLIAFIFFLKDRTEYMPISSSNFDERFELLGIKSDLSGNCTWEKYRQYNDLIKEIKALLGEFINKDITLLDAHSFVWVLPDLEKYLSGDYQIVHHKKYGKGILLGIKDDKVVVQFPDGEKEFLTDIVEKNDLITFDYPNFEVDAKKDRGKNELENAEDIELESLLENDGKHPFIEEIDAFFEHIDKYKNSEQEYESLRKRFVNDYSVEAIEGLTIDQYVIGKDRKDTFCYRIENELKESGNMGGGYSTKFGLYYGVYGEDKTKKYRPGKRFGDDPEEALKTIKEEIVNLINYGQKEDYKAIRSCKLQPMVRGKILSVYYPERYLCIFIDKHLDYFIARLGLDSSNCTDAIDKQRLLLDWKNHEPRLDELSMFMFDRFLYSTFGRPEDSIYTAKSVQSQRDRNYPRKYVSNVKITKNEWKALLKNEEIFRNGDIELLKKIYTEDNHASTMYDLAKREGTSPNSYTFPIVHLAKRISDAMNLEPIIGDDGSRVWWRILFWGRYVQDGHFEWKIRPELAAALAEQYPELDCLGSEEEEDHKLISELNQFKGIQESEDVQYKGGKMKKPEPVFSNGRKAYPRDRKTAANALAHAHFRCEIDSEHVTFIRRSTGKPYTEPHHLVPMAFSDHFDVALDREENIVSLCSNCHNEIHYGQNAEVLIRKLYSDRKQYLESIGVSLSIEQLLEMYDISE